MMTIRATTTILRPAAEVFELVADVERQPEWLSGSMGVELIAGEAMRSGATYRQSLTVGGETNNYVLEVTAAERPYRFVYATSGGEYGAAANVTVEYGFEPVEDGTRVTLSFVTETGRALRLLWPLRFLIRRVGRREAEKVLARLQAAMEADG